jgi:hypothetical protein
MATTGFRNRANLINLNFLLLMFSLLPFVALGFNRADIERAEEELADTMLDIEDPDAIGRKIIYAIFAIGFLAIPLSLCCCNDPPPGGPEEWLFGEETVESNYVHDKRAKKLD